MIQFISLKIIFHFRKPKCLITDVKPKIVSNSLKAYCVRKYVDCVVTNPCHPQANGRFKRIDGFLIQLLSNIKQDDPKKEWGQNLAAVILALHSGINRDVGLRPVTFDFREPALIKEQLDDFFSLVLLSKPPYQPSNSLTRWREAAKEAKQKRLSGQTQHLEEQYKIDNKFYVQNPRKKKLGPDFLGHFNMRKIHNNHIYTIVDAVSNRKRLHHKWLRPCTERASSVR